MANNNLRGVAALEAVLESAQETARKSLDLAQAINRRENDHAQDIAYNRAIAFMKVNAKVGMALAKLKGEHTSNVTICRTEIHAPPPMELRHAARLDPPARSADEIAAEWMRTHGMKPGDDWPVLHPDPEDSEEEGAAATGAGDALATPHGVAARDGAQDRGIRDEEDRGEGDPPRIF